MGGIRTNGEICLGDIFYKANNVGTNGSMLGVCRLVKNGCVGLWLHITIIVIFLKLTSLHTNHQKFWSQDCKNYNNCNDYSSAIWYRSDYVLWNCVLYLWQKTVSAAPLEILSTGRIYRLHTDTFFHRYQLYMFEHPCKPFSAYVKGVIEYIFFPKVFSGDRKYMNLVWSK